MSRPLLEGTVVEPSDADELRQQIRELESELRGARLDADQARNESKTAVAAMMALRDQLFPLFRALKAVMGEIKIGVGDAADPQPANGSASSTAAPADGKAAIWEQWKSELGGAAAKVITALQTHGSADHRQLAILIGTKRMQTVYDAVSKLNKAGLLTKNGDRLSLMQL